MLKTIPLFLKGLPQWMEPHVDLNTDIMPHTLADATLPIIQAWDRHWGHTSM